MQLLEKYNIPTPKSKISKKDENLTFDTFPCVLKITGNYHKSNLGAVITGIYTNEELNKAKEIIIQNLKKHNIEDFEFLIQEEIKGIELFLGSTTDKIFEEVILFGTGGTLVEILKDTTYIDLNSDKEEIIKAVKKAKISKIFPEFRGKKYDLDKVIDIIQNLQKMIKNENISECDLNPLIINEKGVWAVDFRHKTEKKEKKRYIKKEHSLFENKNVAIFGATDKKEKVGYAIAKNALNSKANLYFVNPKLDKLFDKKVCKTTDDLPLTIDTAVITTPKQAVIPIVESMAKRGCKNFIIISAGFKESGDKKSELKLKELADEYKINIIGPNCLGIYNSKMNLNLTFAKADIYPGEIGIISQSGAVLSALIDKAGHYKIGFSHIISMGNMADFNFANAIEELNRQESCKIISIYAEGIQYGKAFLEALRNSEKPVLLFKAGRSDAAKKAAMSHTGNLAGNFEMIMTLSEIAGAKPKDFMESLIFSPLFKSEEVLIVTNAGGPGTILTDYVSKYKKMKKLDDGLLNRLNEVLPSTWSHNNPIDIIGDATAERYEKTLKILKDIDATVYVIITPQFMTQTGEIAEMLKNYDAVPVLLGKDSFTEAEQILKNRLFFTSLQDAVSIL